MADDPTMSNPIEATLARHTVRRAVVVGPPLIVLFWLLRGGKGAVGASVGLAVVVGYFLLSGAMLSAAARRSLAAYHAAALLGFFVRLGLITATLLVVAWLAEVDRPSVGIAAVVSYLVLLSWETVVVAKGSERMLGWTR